MTTELDTARIAEAWGRSGNDGKGAMEYLCDVFNEGWTPPVDPDLIVARGVVATVYPIYREDVIAGGWDDTPTMIIAKAAIKAGRKLAQDERMAG